MFAGRKIRGRGPGVGWTGDPGENRTLDSTVTGWLDPRGGLRKLVTSKAIGNELSLREPINSCKWFPVDSTLGTDLSYYKRKKVEGTNYHG